MLCEAGQVFLDAWGVRVNPSLRSTVTLEIVAGPMRGDSFCFDCHDTFVFGRGSDCHARLAKDAYMSRHQFLLEVNPPQAVLRDLVSLNGTHVNGVRYGGRSAPEGPVASTSQIQLRHGDCIVVGKTKIIFRVTPSPPPPKGSGKNSLPGGVHGLNSKGRTPTRPDGIVPKPLPLATEDRDAGITPSTCNEPLVGRFVGADVDEVVKAKVGERDGGTNLEYPKVPNYAIRRTLAEGGMGVVYFAIRTGDSLPVAVKTLRARIATTRDSRQRFLREVDVLRCLSHPHVCTLLDAGEADNQFYFVVEYCSGGSLADLADRLGGKVPLSTLAPLMLQTLDGLEYSHRAGFVHRDMKPANILLHQLGAAWSVKIGDFGLAKQFEQAGFSGMTITGAYAGTHEYMPREQLTEFRDVAPVSDIWSSAATFYRLITGSVPRPVVDGRDPIEVVLREECLPIRIVDPSVPSALAQVIDRALNIEPKKRFRDARQFRNALQHALSSSLLHRD